MGLLVVKYTSYAILDHKAVDVMHHIVLVCIIFLNDNNRLDVG